MRVVDLFCGSGGFSLGMRRAGFELVAGFDYDTHAMAVHAANLPAQRKAIRIPRKTPPRGHHNLADLFDVLAIAPDVAMLSPDVVVGGPPCTAFSNSGERKGDADPAAKLTEAFASVVAVARPKYFVMENVFNVRKTEVFRRSCSILKKAGYGLTEYECHMSWFGIGQDRERLFLFGALGEAEGWAKAYMDVYRQDRQTTVRDILGDSVGDLYFRIGHRDKEIDKARRSFWASDEPGVVITSSATRQKNSDDGYVVSPADVRFFEERGLYFIYPGGETSPGTRQLDNPSPTLTSKAGDRPGPGYKLRKGDIIDVRKLPMLSLDQLAALAGYPPDWNWNPGPRPTPKGARVLMAANTVPPPISEMIGKTIKRHASSAKVPFKVTMPAGFASWLAGPGGVAAANVGQRISEAKAALRMLASRQLPFIHHALHHLERHYEFRTSPPSRRSNLLKSLKLYYSYRVAIGELEEPVYFEPPMFDDDLPTREPPFFKRGLRPEHLIE